uniref:PHB domain-containing protein n=1 Tax=Steinernema glaseri TaxID=37863 RepID=A0A1I7YY83_9BILA
MIDAERGVESPNCEGVHKDDDEFSILTFFSCFLISVTLPITIFCSTRFLKEHERAVVFRFGKLMKGGPRGPGFIFFNPIIDRVVKVDLRVVSFDVTLQEILSTDSVTVTVYYRISDATTSVTSGRDAAKSTKLLAQTTLRDILEATTLPEMLAEREAISHQMQEALNVAAASWGVSVERVEVKEVRLPLEDT